MYDYVPKTPTDTLVDGYVACQNFLRSVKSKKPLAIRAKVGKEIIDIEPKGILGKGGSKYAIEVQEGRALMLPNTDVDSIALIASRWERMTNEEVAVSNYLKSIGLLSLPHQKIDLILEEEDRSYKIPTYWTESFEQLGVKRGWYIIDQKNSECSTWNKKLFSNDKERLDPKNWDGIFDQALNDYCKLSAYKISTGGDSCNIALVDNKNSGKYEVRYFGFDFSSKAQALFVPAKVSPIKNLKITSKIRAELKNSLPNIIQPVVELEFEFYKFSDINNNLEEYKAALELSKKIAERYSKKIDSISVIQY